MPIPSVDITKSDFNTGVVPPSAEGILAIIAPSATGTKNQPQAFTRADQVLTTFGHGPLSEYAAYVLANSGKPIVCVRCEATVEGAYGSVVETGLGTMVPVAGSSKPYDSFDVLITFVAGGSLGTDGITYRYSLDGGETTSKLLALGTALSITIPDTNVSVTLGTSAQTVLAGQTIKFQTTAPEPNTSDLTTALEALKNTSLLFESILIHATADDAHLGIVDGKLKEMEEEVGKYVDAYLNTKFKGTDTEGDFADDLADIREASTPSTRITFGTDGGYLQSLIRGIRMVRPVALGVAARAMAKDISVEPAFVADGPIPGFTIKDKRGNPLFHDEALNPGPDDNRFTCFRSFEGRSGAYVNNTNLFSPEGSDYQFLPHARVMNRACKIVRSKLEEQLSIGVDVVDGKIHETSAGSIEGIVQSALNFALAGRVSAVKFTLSRTDDLSSNGPATLSGTLEIVSRKLVKKFQVVSRFVRTITTAQAA